MPCFEDEEGTVCGEDDSLSGGVTEDLSPDRRQSGTGHALFHGLQQGRGQPRAPFPCERVRRQITIEVLLFETVTSNLGDAT